LRKEAVPKGSLFFITAFCSYSLIVIIEYDAHFDLIFEKKQTKALKKMAIKNPILQKQNGA